MIKDMTAWKSGAVALISGVGPTLESVHRKVFDNVAVKGDKFYDVEFFSISLLEVSWSVMFISSIVTARLIWERWKVAQLDRELKTIELKKARKE